MNTPSFSVAEAIHFVDSGATVLDVRELDEWRLGQIDGSTHPLGDPPDRVDDRPTTSFLYVYRSGSRSNVTSLSLIQSERQAFNLDGGVLAWSLDGIPLVADHDHPSVG